MQLHDLFRFYIEYPTGEKQVFPYNESIEFRNERGRGRVAYRKSLETELNFRDNSKDSSIAFSDLYAVERWGDKCQKLPIRIEKKCQDVWETYWNGELALVDGNWNVDLALLAIKPRLKDEYSCLYRKWENKVNLLDHGIGRRLQSRIGNIVTHVCTCEGTPIQCGPLDQYTTCAEVSHSSWTVSAHRGDILFSGNHKKETTYIREEYLSNTPPPGGGWETDGTSGGFIVWAKPVQVTLIETVSAGNIYSETYEFADFRPDNAHSLNTSLISLVRDCNLTIVSDFLGINPDSTHPTNTAYTEALANCQELYFFQKSDVRDVNASENATRLEMSFKELWEILKTMFNLDFVIENSVLRIEHISYWANGNKMLNLTESSLQKYLRGKFHYDYDREKLPMEERFFWMEETDSTTTAGDFDGVPIRYDGLCHEPDYVEEFRVNLVTTNVDYIVQNPGQISNEGMVIVATGLNAILSEEGRISGISKLNAHLSWANLHYNYHRWNRPQKTAIINDLPQVIYWHQRTRRQVPISVPFTCSDIAIFEANDLVKTQLGWGEVDQASEKFPESIVEFQLLHD